MRRLGSLAMVAVGLVVLGFAAWTRPPIQGGATVTGRVKFTGANDIGAQLLVNMHNVEFTPTGSINLIDDDDWEVALLEREPVLQGRLDLDDGDQT